jgi:branched-subunit amino acid aminotransferase/4-amino-4-deoxychorismate lyase
VLHYAQEIFEGLKAYQHADGSVWLFRPDKNAERMARSAPPPGAAGAAAEDFLGSIDALIEAGRRVGAQRPRAEPVPAAVHVRLRGLSGRTPGQAGDLLLHREPGRAVLRLGGCTR